MMIRNKKLGIFFAILLAIGIGAWLYAGHDRRAFDQNAAPLAIINGREIKLEIADTPASRFQGLSDRPSICEDCGMLFEFDRYAVQTFVMRRMSFPLDIVWIKDDRIVGIDKNLPPEGVDPKNLYSSLEPVNRVLEVNGGFCDRHGIRIGDLLTIHN